MMCETQWNRPLKKLAQNDQGVSSAVSTSDDPCRALAARFDVGVTTQRAEVLQVNPGQQARPLQEVPMLAQETTGAVVVADEVEPMVADARQTPAEQLRPGQQDRPTPVQTLPNVMQLKVPDGGTEGDGGTEEGGALEMGIVGWVAGVLMAQIPFVQLKGLQHLTDPHAMPNVAQLDGVVVCPRSEV